MHEWVLNKGKGWPECRRCGATSAFSFADEYALVDEFGYVRGRNTYRANLSHTRSDGFTCEEYQLARILYA